MFTYILTKLAKKYGEVAEFLYYFPGIPILGDVIFCVVICIFILTLVRST